MICRFIYELSWFVYDLSFETVHIRLHLLFPCYPGTCPSPPLLVSSISWPASTFTGFVLRYAKWPLSWMAKSLNPGCRASKYVETFKSRALWILESTGLLCSAFDYNIYIYICPFTHIYIYILYVCIHYTMNDYIYIYMCLNSTHYGSKSLET